MEVFIDIAWQSEGSKHRFQPRSTWQRMDKAVALGVLRTDGGCRTFPHKPSHVEADAPAALYSVLSALASVSAHRCGDHCHGDRPAAVFQPAAAAQPCQAQIAREDLDGSCFSGRHPGPGHGLALPGVLFLQRDDTGWNVDHLHRCRIPCGSKSAHRTASPMDGPKLCSWLWRVCCRPIVGPASSFFPFEP